MIGFLTIQLLVFPDETRTMLTYVCRVTLYKQVQWYQRCVLPNIRCIEVQTVVQTSSSTPLKLELFGMHTSSVPTQ